MSERDIVEVLRDISGEHGDQLGFAECQEAANEIASLRAEVERLRTTPTLTDAERDDLEMWLAECLKQGVTAEMACEVECANRWAARAARAAAILARHGGDK